VADNRASIVIESKAAVAPGFRQVKREFDLLKSAGKQVNNVFTGIGQGIGQRFAGVMFDAVRGVTDLFTQAVPKALAYAKSIDDISDASGASAEQASKLAGTLDLLGIPTEGLAATFRTLASEVVTNEKKLEALGIQVRDSNGNLLDTVTILDNARSKFGQLGDGAAKTALAVDLFGRSALGLIDYLNLSDEAAAAAADELERMGLILSDDAVRNAEDADRSFNLLGMTINGLQIELANQLIPTIIDVVTAIRTWVMENREGLINGLQSVLGAIAGFISGLVGASNAAKDFLGTLRGLTGGVNTNKAGILAQIQALQKQRAAYAASGAGASGAGGANSRLTASINKQIEALRRQKTALMEVVRAQAAAAAAAYSGILAGLDASEQQYQLDLQRKQLQEDLAAAEAEAADARTRFARELRDLRDERDLAMAAEADADKQFQIAVEYAQKEDRLLQEQADEATRLDKAIADARKRISDFELEVKRQAIIAEKKERIEAAQSVSAEIRKLAEADYGFDKNIQKLQQMEADLQSQLKIARANGDSLAVQLIEIQLAQITDAIRAQQEAKEIARHQRELERQRARASGAKASSNTVLAAIDAEIAKLKEQLRTYEDLGTNGIDPTAGKNKKFIESMEKWKQIAQDVKTAFTIIGDVFKTIGWLYDTFVQPIIDGVKALISVIRTAISLLGQLAGKGTSVPTGNAGGAGGPGYGGGGNTGGGSGYPASGGKIGGGKTGGGATARTPARPLPGQSGGRAFGGPVTAGDAFLVGEKGPELFLPNSAGMIVQGANAGGINITLSAGAFLGNTQDAKEFARRIAGALEDEMSRRRKIQPNLTRRMAS
jgi:hypothetical protein